MTTKQRKRVSSLKLNAAELRRELIHADTIIKNAIGSMVVEQIEGLALMNEINANSDTSDPFRSKARSQAMHRITPKRDYLKTVLAVLLGFFITAWYCAYTENDLLRTELARAQSQPVQVVKSPFSKGGFRGISQAVQGE